MRRGVAIVALLVGMALVAGCGDDDEPDTVTETVTQTEPATTGTAQETTTEAEPEGGTAKVEKAQAEENAREEATRQLESQPGGFSVAESDWQVSCKGGESGGPWTCTLESGPCNGTATVTPRDDGAVATEAKVGCIAE